MQNGKIVRSSDFDAVYVHLVKNYYAKGYASWVDSVQLFKAIDDRGRILEPLLIGKTARNIQLADTLSSCSLSVRSQKQVYRTLLLDSRICGHCKKEVPKLADIYHKMKKDGIDVEVYAPAIMAIEEFKKWTDFIREHNLDWVNVADPYRQNNFRFEWDIQTPLRYTYLDKDKKIKAKRIGAEQIEDFIKPKSILPTNLSLLLLFRMETDVEPH
jgi:hypothetical protein